MIGKDERGTKFGPPRYVEEAFQFLSLPADSLI